MTRKTVGQEAVERLQNADHKQEVGATAEEINKKYYEGIQECVDNTDWTEPFFIVVHRQKVKQLVNTMRNRYWARRTLPTPQWDSDVWRYYPKSGNLEFIWSLPDEDSAKFMYSYPEMVPVEQRQLLEFVVNFVDGKLYDIYHREFESGSQLAGSECVSP